MKNYNMGESVAKDKRQDLNEIYYIYRSDKGVYYASKSIDMVHGNSYIICYSASDAQSEVARRNRHLPKVKAPIKRAKGMAKGMKGST